MKNCDSDPQIELSELHRIAARFGVAIIKSKQTGLYEICKGVRTLACHQNPTMAMLNAGERLRRRP